MENLVQSNGHREAWNKGKLVGQRAPLRLRGDLVKLPVRDVTHVIAWRDARLCCNSRPSAQCSSKSPSGSAPKSNE
jgi:hypothetical protein